MSKEQRIKERKSREGVDSTHGIEFIPLHSQQGRNGWIRSLKDKLDNFGGKQRLSLLSTRTAQVSLKSEENQALQSKVRSS